MTDLQAYLLRNLERIFCILALMTLAGALAPYLFGFRSGAAISNRDFAAEVDAGNVKFQTTTLAIYSIGLLYLLAERNRLPKLLVGNWAMLTLTGLALFSALWSYYPDTTFRRAFALLLTTTFAYYLVLRYTPRELLQLIAWALLLGAALSLVLVILYPSSTIYRGGPLVGSWMGSFGHKNRLGRMMALAVIIFTLLLLEQGGKTRWFNWAGLVLCGFMLAMSQSRTAWITTLVLLMFIPALRFLRGARLPMSLRLGSLLILGFAVVMAVTQFLVIGLEAVGRDLTFTGRTTIWTHAVVAGMNHPMLGAGVPVLLDTRRGELCLCTHLGRDRQRSQRLSGCLAGTGLRRSGAVPGDVLHRRPAGLFAPCLRPGCQSASESDPRSACKVDPRRGWWMGVFGSSSWWVSGPWYCI
jgi:exopolysaccharide production protein ExoQ